MSTRQRPGPGIDEEAYQKALDDLKRLLDEGDDSDTSWQDDLPEAPDFPRKQIMQVAQEALDRRGPGTEIHFQFSCPACGSRCTMEEANVLYERGECYACGADSPVEQAGFLVTNGPVVGPLTPPVGNA